MFESGRIMTCLICGRKERADGPAGTSWRAITLGDPEPYYLCPLELPEGGRGAEDFALAYQIIILAIVIKREGGLLMASPLGPWIAARRTGKVPRYSYDAFLRFLPTLIGSGLN
jgi:hypothetical protein